MSELEKDKVVKHLHKSRSAGTRLIHLVPADVFTEGSLTKVALKRRASSLEAIAHDLFEENQNLQESLKGGVKKRAKEESKFFF